MLKGIGPAGGKFMRKTSRDAVHASRCQQAYYGNCKQARCFLRNVCTARARVFGKLRSKDDHARRGWVPRAHAGYAVLGCVTLDQAGSAISFVLTRLVFRVRRPPVRRDVSSQLWPRTRCRKARGDWPNRRLKQRER